MEDLQASTLHDVAVKQRVTIAFAESCTGGLIGARITAVSGVSAWFCGSAVVYATEAKARILGLDRAGLREHGPVSIWAAAQLAIKARERFDSQIAIAVTGVAGPDPDERGVLPGMLYVGWTDGENGGVLTHVLDAGGSEGRARVRAEAADIALETAIWLARARTS